MVVTTVFTMGRNLHAGIAITAWEKITLPGIACNFKLIKDKGRERGRG